MDVGQLQTELDDVLVVDVREQDEFDAGHLASSVHLPLGRVASEGPKLAAGRPVVTVCRTGSRSAEAASLLRDAGLDAQSLDGGLKAWVAAGGSLAGPAGSDGTVLDPPASEHAELEGNLIEVAYGLQERYGNRAPTDDEAREFMREWLSEKGVSKEEIEQILE